MALEGRVKITEDSVEFHVTLVPLRIGDRFGTELHPVLHHIVVLEDSRTNTCGNGSLPSYQTTTRASIL